MKKALFLLVIFVAASALWGQQKFALVIGNSDYKGISKLGNPVNDANDMEAALKGLGFTVEKVMNGNLEQMENAVTNLKRRLGATSNSYGFFFYAGHGVQANGENYLIPVEASNIQNDTHLRQRAVSLQFVLDSLNEAGNQLNMVVLDACRDNPFGWARSGSRGLSVVSQTPRGSIVMYATGANSVASDGTGKNGLFTSHLLTNLKTAGLSVFEVFDKTMGDVSRVTDGKQEPELSLRFSGAHTVYLGTRPAPVATAPVVQPTPQTAPVPAPAPSVQPAPTPAPAPVPVAAQPPVNPAPISNKRYEVVEKTLGWAAAKRKAESRGGYLAVINDAEEQRIIEDMISKGKKLNYWLGGFREGRAWKWVNNEPMNYTNWAPGEPNDLRGMQNKMTMRLNGQWDDQESNRDFGYIIEWD